MAAIRKVEKHGRVRWRVSSYDALGQRHQRFFATKADAEQHQADAIQSRKAKLTSRTDPRVTVRDYAARWLPEHAAAQQLKPATRESYEAVLRRHILPVRVGRQTFGDLRVSAVRRPLVKALLAAQRAQDYAPGTVRLTHGVLCTLFESTVEDELLVVNPAHRLRKQLRLGISAEAKAEAVAAKAMTQEELDHALTVARARSPLFGLYLVLARTGLRIGEALGLQDPDLDGEDRRLRVVRSLSRHGIGTPKSGCGRAIDLSADAVAVLKSTIADKKRLKLAGAFATLPPWTFCTSRGTPYTARNVLRDWHRVQRLAGLLEAAGHPRFGLHGFRHTFASLHILHGANLAWLQEQLGHVDIRLTRTIYGSAFKLRDLAAADRQDRRSELVVTGVVTQTADES